MLIMTSTTLRATNPTKMEKNVSINLDIEY